MRKYTRSFNFLNFQQNYITKPLDSIFINNDHNLNIVHNSYFDPKKKKPQSYEFFMEKLLESSQNAFLTDGSANIFKHRFKEISMERVRFCVGDLDSLRTESILFLARRQKPLILYEDQDKTDLEKCLDLANEFQKSQSEWRAGVLDQIEIVDPLFQPDHDCVTAQEALSVSHQNPFLSGDMKDIAIKSLRQSIVPSVERNIVVFDYLGSRMDHVL